jgi:4-azaleucine resistance transporter AzlC
MLDKFKNVDKKKKAYLIFALTDETYALLCSAAIPGDAGRDDYLFFTALLNQCYWVAGSAIGSVAGALIPFNTKGIDFAMTALFVVILTEQVHASKSIATAAIGAGCAVIALFIFGAGAFILPAMLAITALLIGLRKPLEKGAGNGGCP